MIEILPFNQSKVSIQRPDQLSKMMKDQFDLVSSCPIFAAKFIFKPKI